MHLFYANRVSLTLDLPLSRTTQTSKGQMNIENDAWKGDGDSRSPFPAQVRCKPTRVQGSLSASSCRNWIRTLRPLADDSTNKKFRLDLNPAETAAFIRMFVFGVKVDYTSSQQPGSPAAANGHHDADGWETVGPKKKEVRKDGRASSGPRRNGDSGMGGRKSSIASISNAGDNSGMDTPDEEPGSPAAPRVERAPTGWAAILTGRADSASLPTSAAEAAAKEAAAKEAELLRIKEQEAERIRKEKEEARVRAEAERISKQAHSEAPGSPKTEPKRVASPAPGATKLIAASKEPVRAPAQAAASSDGASKPFKGWASVVTGATPDPAKEGWQTLVEGKLDAEKQSTATVTITSETVNGAPIDAAVKKAPPAEQVSEPQSPNKSPASSVENDDMTPLKKAWSGWAVKNPPPTVDLKAEMEEEAKKAATKVKAVTIDPASSPGVEDGVEGKKKEGKREKKEKKEKDGGDGKATRGVPQPQRGKNAQGANASPRPPPPPTSPPLASPNGVGAPARPFSAAPAPPREPAAAPEGAIVSEVGCAELTDEIRAKLAERIGREMLETARVQPFSVKGNVLRIERRAVDMLIRTMNAIVQSLYPTASVEVFGSFPTASWVPGASNLDIALSLPEAVTSDPQKKLDALNSLAVALRANPHWVNEVNVVPSPFRPLILLTTHSAFFQPPPPPQAAQGPRPPPGAPPAANGGSPAANGDSPGAPPLPPGPPPPAASVGFGLGNGGVGLPLEVAISIKGKDHKGAAAMKFLRQAETEYPALAPVLAVQKAYLAKRGLRGVYKGGIGSYSLALMALHSMQQAAARSAGAEGGLGAGDDDMKDAKILGDSLLQFLEMYGHTVDLTKASIKVHALKPGKGKKAAEAHEAARKADWGVLPAPTSGDGPRAAMGGGTLQVQDPTQTGNNAGSGCFGVVGVQAAFKDQLKQLMAVPADASLLQHILTGAPGKVCVV